MLRRALLAIVAFAAMELSLVPSAYSEVGSDQGAAILVFPKIVVDTSTPPATTRGRIDTLVRVTNISERPVSLKCFYVNANGHCRAAPATVCDPYDLDAPNNCAPDDPCVAGWQQTDFFLTLTPRQPAAWIASQGATRCDLSPDPDAPCFPLAENLENRVPPVPENPFTGYLKCLAVDRNEAPVERNDLVGTTDLVRSNENPDLLDIEQFNAIGIPAIPGTNDFDRTLVVGGAARCASGERVGQPCGSDDECPRSGCLIPEYEGCPNILVMDHLFEGAADPLSGSIVNSRLTLVPCSDDFERDSRVSGPIQFLVFNEFEQRFSTSYTIDCFHEFKLTDIQGRSEVRSIFSAAVNGTLTGQTRMRGVAGSDSRIGYTWLGVVEEYRSDSGSAAFQLHFHGSRPESDFIRLP